MEVYFTINVRLITHSVDVETANVLTPVLFLSIPPQCTLTVHAGVGYLAPGTRFWEMRVALGRSLSRGEYSSVKGAFAPVALETAPGDLIFFLLAETLNARV